MGEKGGWFSALKKALSSSKKLKSSKKLSDKDNENGVASFSENTTSFGLRAPPPPPPPSPPPSLPLEGVKLNQAENEQSKHAYSVAIATAVAAEAAVLQLPRLLLRLLGSQLLHATPGNQRKK